LGLKIVLKKRTYLIGGIAYTSQKKVKDKWKGIMKKYTDSEEHLSEGTDFDFLLDSTRLHKRRKQKIGCGIKSFFVEKAPGHNSKCWWILRVDGSMTDISPGGIFESAFQTNSDALRQIARPDCDAYKKKHLETHSFTKIKGGDLEGEFEYVASEFSGEMLSAEDSSLLHTHHAEKEHKHLVIEFFETRPEDPFLDDLTVSHDCSSTPRFKDPDLPDEWRRFHLNTAKFQVVSVTENLSDCKKQATSGDTNFHSSH
jgi:hypothetical protein